MAVITCQDSTNWGEQSNLKLRVSVAVITCQGEPLLEPKQAGAPVLTNRTEQVSVRASIYNV